MPSESTKNLKRNFSFAFSDIVGISAIKTNENSELVLGKRVKRENRGSANQSSSEDQGL